MVVLRSITYDNGDPAHDMSAGCPSAPFFLSYILSGLPVSWDTAATNTTIYSQSVAVCSPTTAHYSHV